MLMRTREEHNCRTTFAGGVNIFTGLRVGMPEGTRKVTDKLVAAFLRENGPSTGPQLAEGMDAAENNVYKVCARMAKMGTVIITKLQREGIKSCNLYSLWEDPEGSLIKAVMHYIKLNPGTKAGDLLKYVNYRPVGSTLHRLFLEGKVKRKRDGRTFQYWSKE